MKSVPAFVLVCLLGPGSLAAQSAPPAGRPMTLDDIFAMKRVSDPQISPDGKAVAYVVSVVNPERDRWDSHLWLVEPGGTPRPLTTGTRRDTAPRWSPDGKTVAFLRAPAEESPFRAQIFLLAADGGEARALTDAPLGVSSFQWAPDGASVFYLAPERPGVAAVPREVPRRAEPQVEDEGRLRARLWRIGVAGGGAARYETIENHVREFALAPDGSAVVFSAAPSSYFNDGPQSELYLLSLRHPASQSNNQPRLLTTNNFIESGMAWRPDGSGFMFLADADTTFQQRALQGSLFYWQLGTGRIRHLPVETAVAVQEKFVGSLEQAEWLDSERLVIVAGSGTNQHLYQFSFAASRTLPLTRGQEVSARVSTSRGTGRVAFLRQAPGRPDDVWLLDAGKGLLTIGGDARDRQPQRITDHHSPVAQMALPHYEVIRWRASDGVEVEGILLTPAEGTGPWPLVTLIHGGPASAEMAGFQASPSRSAQVMTGMGIAVFLPNYRGSTNYGEAFAARSIGDRNGRDARDIEEGVDALIARGVADKNRLGLLGWSAGGVLTNWLVATNPRYRAASSGAGVADWTMQYFLSDYTYGSALYFGGTPWEKRELYWERSPLRLAAQVKAPVLIHSGASDERVPIAHTRAWYRALREHGVTTRFIVYPGEPHSLQQPSSQRRRLEEDLAWFRTYLLAP